MGPTTGPSSPAHSFSMVELPLVQQPGLTLFPHTTTLARFANDTPAAPRGSLLAIAAPPPETPPAPHARPATTAVCVSRVLESSSCGEGRLLILQGLCRGRALQPQTNSLCQVITFECRPDESRYLLPVWRQIVEALTGLLPAALSRRVLTEIAARDTSLESASDIIACALHPDPVETAALLQELDCERRLLMLLALIRHRTRNLIHTPESIPPFSLN